MSHIGDADIDRVLDGDSTTDERSRMLAHMATCAECRSQWDDVLRAHDAMVSSRINVPNDLAGGATAGVATTTRAAVQRRPRRRVWTTLLARAAGVALAIGLGAAGERLRARAASRTTPAAAAQAGYLFVFSGTRAALLSGDERADIARSFRTWTDSLRRAGQLVAVGQLTRDAPRLISATEPNLDSAAVRAFASMEGFYVLLARDDADAVVLARTCPYLRFGGTIVVRRRTGSARPVAAVRAESTGPTPRVHRALATMPPS
jgi:hypothetical protein